MNKIEKIKNNKGERLSSSETIENELYGNLNNIWTFDIKNNLNCIKELIKPSISPEDNSKLIDISSSEAIKNAIFQVGTLKSPGPDGYLAKCYQQI